MYTRLDRVPIIRERATCIDRENENDRGKKKRKERERETWGSSIGNDPPRDDRLHNDPTGIVRKLIADKIERSQDGIKEKAVNCTISLRIYDQEIDRPLDRNTS